jgi:plastocyanin
MALLAWFLGVVTPAGFADDYTVSVNSNFFDPPEIVILPGDNVIWDWVSGFHNTTSDDGLWASDTTFPPFDFEFTFTDPGDYFYYCSIHGGPGLNGMSGIIHVMDVCP